MKDFNALSYLLFKHSNLLSRRYHCFVQHFLYRSLLMMIIYTFFIIFNDFSGAAPFQTFFIAFFMAFLSPLQYFMDGISAKDYGYDVLHRIFGEYKKTKIRYPFDAYSTF